MLQKKIRNIYTNSLYSTDEMKAYVQPFFEMRYVLEHFSDAFFDKEGNGIKDEDLIKEELKKARLHLLRCYADLSEWRFVCAKERIIKINKKAKRLSKDDVEKVIPNYYSEFLDAVDKIQGKLLQFKNEPEDMEKRENALDSFYDECNTLPNSFRFNENAYKELMKRARRDVAKRIFIFLVGSIIGAIIGAVVALFIK